MQSLNISVVQTELVWENIEANLANFSNLLKDTRTTDLIVLPETFSTGFTMRPEVFAKESTEKTLAWLLEKSKELNAAICGSLIYEENEKYYNAFVFVKPDGSIEKYFKRHLFSPGDESNHYTKGRKRLIIDYKGWKICPQICYDLRFPVFSRNTDNYDLLIYVANWPAKRNYAWQHLLKARAIENVCYVVACNRIGEDGNGVEHIGNSCIINYVGEEIGFSNENKVYSFNLNKTPLLDFRKSFSVLEDADAFEIK